MARLLTWNDALGLTALEIVNGPNVRNSGANSAQDGSEQTFEGVGSLWTFRLGLPMTQGRAARQERGILDALGGGENAVRFTVIDRDMMSPAEAGIVGASSCDWFGVGGQNWSNGMPWSNGMSWKTTAPTVRVAADAPANSGIIQLRDEYWGHRLGVGDQIGFFPFHFGMYRVIEVIEPGVYRVGYRLRKALKAGDYATLYPVIALRPMSKDAAIAPGQVPGYTDSGSILLTEVIDPYVRKYFADPPPSVTPTQTPWILADGRWDDFGEWRREELF